MDENTKFNAEVQNRIQKITRKLRQDQPFQIRLFSERHSTDIAYSTTNNDQPFHIASVGKTFTATLIGILHDKELLDIDHTINKYLDDATLQGLFIYQGTDYKDTVTIRQLLGHTSGIADYFEGKVHTGQPFLERLSNVPEKLWTPQELVDFTRDNQSPIGPPGTFGYTDTGYILLGLVIEKVTKKSLAAALAEYIFAPLTMKDSYMLFSGKPINPEREIAPVYLRGKKLTLQMLSCDWAGGGIVSTTQDLLRFQRAFWKEELVSSQFIREMATFKNTYRPGMHYGLGMMEIRFEGFFFLLRGLPRPLGHTGVFAVHMYYDAEHDLHVIMNFGNDKMMVKSFQLFTAIEQSAKKYLIKHEGYPR